MRRQAPVSTLALASSLCAAPLLARPAENELPALLARTPPTIDGMVGEAEWQGAAVASDFIQYEPQRGEPSRVRTEALLLYDKANLYVAFRAFDAEPLTAQLTRRDDDLFADDAVVVLLDSSFDHQSAFYFMTNPLGTQADGRIAEDGRQRDIAWDAPWRSAVRRTDTGWEAEIDIPLRSIKYASGEGRTWGLNLGRSRRRSLEVSYWVGPLDNRDRVSQAGRLVGLNVPPPEDRIQVIPYGLTQVQEGTSPAWQAGADARYALTSELALYATVNPDFATIEADRETVNLTRFELALPEKRQFFLEGQELFQQKIRTFYSRRVGDIDFGGKLLGRQGRTQLEAIVARTPSLETGDRATYAVGRVQRDLGRSYVAAMVANRNLASRNQGMAQLDTNLFFTKSFGLAAQIAESYGPFDRGTLGFFVRPAYDSPTTHLHLRYTHLGEHFAENVNAVGFVRDDDRRELDSAFSRILWPKAGPVERVAYDSNYNVYWSQAGPLRSWEIRQSLDVELRSRWSFGSSWVEDLQRFEKDFRNRQIGLRLGYNTREFQAAEVGLRWGRNFDSDFRLWTAAAGLKLSGALSLQYELERLDVEPDPERHSTWIHVVRLSQFFTKDLYLRAFFQTNSAIDRKNAQAVFVWRYKPPFGTVQLAYQRGTAEFGERSNQGDTLFFKVTTVF